MKPENKARVGSDAKSENSDIAEHARICRIIPPRGKNIFAAGEHREQIACAFFAHIGHIPTVRKFRIVARTQP